MKRRPSLVKYLDRRNLKAVEQRERRKADVPVDPGGGTPERGGRRSALRLRFDVRAEHGCQAPKPLPEPVRSVKRDEAEPSPLDTWMA